MDHSAAFNPLFSHKLGSLGAVRANERMDKPVAHYLLLDFFVVLDHNFLVALSHIGTKRCLFETCYHLSLSSGVHEYSDESTPLFLLLPQRDRQNVKLHTLTISPKLQISGISKPKRTFSVWLAVRNSHFHLLPQKEVNFKH